VGSMSSVGPEPAPAGSALRRDPSHDGTRAFGEAAAGARWPWLSWPAQLTLLPVVGPLAALVIAVVLAVLDGLSLFPLVLAAVLYTVTGLGITVGLHRGITHGSYRASVPGGAEGRHLSHPPDPQHRRTATLVRGHGKARADARLDDHRWGGRWAAGRDNCRAPCRVPGGNPVGGLRGRPGAISAAAGS